MKFFRADIDGAVRVGVLTADGAVLLSERFRDLVDVIDGAPGSLDAARSILPGGQH
jgi:hypothetical protein